jgi:SHS2 domain-containing protein
VGQDEPVVAKERGRRVVAHTADVILEAWGFDLPSCGEEAVSALVDTYVDSRRAKMVEHRRGHFGPGRQNALLLEVLERQSSHSTRPTPSRSGPK